MILRSTVSAHVMMVRQAAAPHATPSGAVVSCLEMGADTGTDPGVDMGGADTGRELLLVRLSYKDHRHRKWAFPGGFVDVGETPEEAVKREAFEELQVQLGTLSQLTITPMLAGEKPNIGFLYRCDAWQGELEISTWELLEFRWVDAPTFAQLAAADKLAYSQMVEQVARLGL